MGCPIYLMAMVIFCQVVLQQSNLGLYIFFQPPFLGGNRDKIQQKIIKDKIKLPAFLSSEAHSLLKGVSSSLSICFYYYVLQIKPHII